MKMRQSFDKAFKTKVVLDSLREELNLQEIAKKYDVHPNQISLWIKQAIESLPEIFERPNKKTEGERQAETQYNEALKTLGAMMVENEFLKKVQAPVRVRSVLINRVQTKMSIAMQCQALGISRSVAYYDKGFAIQNHDILVLDYIRSVLERRPFYGYRKVAREISAKYILATEKQVRRRSKLNWL